MEWDRQIAAFIVGLTLVIWAVGASVVCWYLVEDATSDTTITATGLRGIGDAKGKIAKPHVFTSTVVLKGPAESHFGGVAPTAEVEGASTTAAPSTTSPSTTAASSTVAPTTTTSQAATTATVTTRADRPTPTDPVGAAGPRPDPPSDVTAADAIAPAVVTGSGASDEAVTVAAFVLLIGAGLAALLVTLLRRDGQGGESGGGGKSRVGDEPPSPEPSRSDRLDRAAQHALEASEHAIAARRAAGDARAQAGADDADPDDVRAHTDRAVVSARRAGQRAEDAATELEALGKDAEVVRRLRDRADSARAVEAEGTSARGLADSADRAALAALVAARAATEAGSGRVGTEAA